MFVDRIDAGKKLAIQLVDYQNQPNTWVFGLPRGGVPIAAICAKKLNLPLDIILIRKLGLPWHPELAMGAIGLNDVCIVNQDVVDEQQVSANAFEQVKEKEQLELERRNHKYRQGKVMPELSGATAIIVDDGIATGATMRPAIAVLRAFDVTHIVVAVPVASIEVYSQFGTLADEVIALETPQPLYSISQWYHSFPQVSDDEVIQHLRGQVDT